MKIAITGGNGLLGSTLLRQAKMLDVEAVQLTRDIFNCKTTLSMLTTFLEKVGCSVLIHCAANTNVEACEDDVLTCYKDNVLLTELLINACRINSIKLVFISSTGIYGNYQDAPYCEYDDVFPTTNHHRSKWLAEQKINQLLTDFLIIRTGWLFGGDWSMNKNFVANRIKESLNAVGSLSSDDSQYGNPTYVHDVSAHIFKLIEQNWCGTFNCVNKGRASRFEYVSEVIRLSGINILVEPIAGAAFNRKAKVSHNESAINFKLSQFGLDAMPSWKDSLASYISTIRSEYERT